MCLAHSSVGWWFGLGLASCSSAGLAGLRHGVLTASPRPAGHPDFHHLTAEARLLEAQASNWHSVAPGMLISPSKSRASLESGAAGADPPLSGEGYKVSWPFPNPPHGILHFLKTCLLLYFE